MKLLAFFLCESASQRKDELWNFTGAPLHHLIAKSFPAQLPLLVFLEVAETDVSKDDALTLAIVDADKKVSILEHVPLDKFGPLLSLSRPVMTNMHAEKKGAYDLLVLHGLQPLAQYPLVVLKAS